MARNRSTIQKYLFLFIGILTGIILNFNAIGPKAVFAEPTLTEYCSDAFYQSGECPEDLCRPGCVYLKVSGDKCLPGCEPRPCIEIDPEHCPQKECQLIFGCTGQDVCFSRPTEHPPECGHKGYNRQEVECCEGMIRRCGVEFFDGSCDMIGKYSHYVAPICVPCGNGICDQFENRCNCPEDCAN